MSQLQETAALMDKCVYTLTDAGYAAAAISLASGFSVEETASFLLTASLAWDARTAIQDGDFEKTIRLSNIGIELLRELRWLAEDRKIREKLFRNDARAIQHIIIPSEETEKVISLVLSDPTVSEKRPAICRLL